MTACDRTYEEYGKVVSCTLRWKQVNVHHYKTFKHSFEEEMVSQSNVIDKFNDIGVSWQRDMEQTKS